MVEDGRRTDHELELAAIIGRGGANIAEKDALSYVAGYAIGLDMTIRGPEERSLRKSLDHLCGARAVAGHRRTKSAIRASSTWC